MDFNDSVGCDHDQTTLKPYVIVQEGSSPEYKETVFVNPQKNIRREISYSNGFRPEFPGVENMELLRKDCGNGICVHILHDVEFQPSRDNRTRMIWEAQTEGGAIPSVNG